jgi:hypothetical protein
MNGNTYIYYCCHRCCCSLLLLLMRHTGQYGFVVLSNYPLESRDAKTFQYFRWKDMPGALLPTNPDGTQYYLPEELNVRLISACCFTTFGDCVPLDLMTSLLECSGCCCQVTCHVMCGCQVPHNMIFGKWQRPGLVGTCSCTQSW